MVKNYKKLKVRALWCISVLFCLLFTVPVNGQTVTVNGTNSGSLSVMGSSKYFATWRHVQAPLSIITSNGTDFGNVASNLHIAEKETATKGKLECYNWGTHYKNCYIKMTLPVGYRFTDYHITMQRKGEAADTEGGQLYFYETSSDFSTTSPIKKGSSDKSCDKVCLM